jgi:hypothetical protein
VVRLLRLGSRNDGQWKRDVVEEDAVSEEESRVWLKTEPSPDGSTYMVTVEIDEDRAIPLTPESAPQYAMTILQAVARAEYDAAVFQQLHSLVPDMEAVAQIILDLRKDRADIDTTPTKPLEIEGGVNQKGEPFLYVRIDGEIVGQWDVSAAKKHVLAALEMCAVADLDAGYYRALVGLVGLDEGRARNVVDDLQHHRVDAPT